MLQDGAFLSQTSEGDLCFHPAALLSQQHVLISSLCQTRGIKETNPRNSADPLKLENRVRLLTFRAMFHYLPNSLKEVV